jgi:hypothetical protein
MAFEHGKRLFKWTIAIVSALPRMRIRGQEQATIEPNR